MSNASVLYNVGSNLYMSVRRSDIIGRSSKDVEYNMSRKRKVIGTCGICKTPRSILKRGHIIPDWAYRLGELNENTMIAVANDGIETPFSSYNGSLTTAYLFCGPCEEWLGEGEDELRRTFFSSNSHKDKTSSVIRMKNFPYFEIEAPKRKLMERAIVGILFKCHFVSSTGKLSIFNNNVLSKTQFRKIQRALTKGAVESDNFDFLNFYFFKLFSFRPEINNVDRGVLSTHQTIRHIPGISTLFVFAGLAILIYSSNNKQSHSFKVRLADIEDFGFPFDHYPDPVRLLAPLGDRQYAAQLKGLALRYDSNDVCPCGLSWTDNKKITDQRRTYGDCCKQKWFFGI